MNAEVTLRAFRLTDLESVLKIYPAAFPEEDLVPLVQDLAGCSDVRSFLAVRENRIVGHVAFTMCRLRADDREFALLAPLAVHPEFMRQGVGSQLVRTGIDAMRQRRVAAVLVLGDPAYYGRFGFRAERNILAPYPLREDWADAWQSLWISDNQLRSPEPLVVPGPWTDQALWR